jgi:molybdopterin-biosynthesis enzyme MoeA-like protein
VKELTISFQPILCSLSHAYRAIIGGSENGGIGPRHDDEVSRIMTRAHTSASVSLDDDNLESVQARGDQKSMHSEVFHHPTPSTYRTRSPFSLVLSLKTVKEANR